METLENWFKMLENIEVNRACNDTVADMWGFFYWPNTTVAWELLIELREQNFIFDEKQEFPRLFKIFGAMLTTTPAEYAARQVRIREAANTAKKMNQLEKWHSLATSAILNDHSRQHITVTDTAMQHRSSTVPRTTFDARIYDNSLKERFSSFAGPPIG